MSKLTGCSPILIRKVEAILRDLQGHGLHPVVVEGKRTLARQKELYAQGRTKPGRIVTWTLYSNHLTGRAADIAFIVKKKLTWDVPDRYWRLLGSSARAHELRWGGDWQGKKQDRPHVELP